jgi:hypothetical protein
MLLSGPAGAAADYDLDTSSCALASGPSAISILTDRTFQIRQETGGHRVIQAAGDWSAFWSEHGAGKPRPEADAEKAQVVVAWLGEKPHPGHGIRLAGVRCSGTALTLTFGATEPDPEMDYPMMLYYPAAAVAVPKAADPVEVVLP